MATEKRLIPDGEKVTLAELLPGTIFAFGGLTFASGNAGDDCIAVKSEYRCSNGLIEAFIIDSGEQFWGGAKTAREQNELRVQPLAIVEVDAVEVVRCKDCISSLSGGWICGGPSFTMPSHPTYPDAFCSYGDRKAKPTQEVDFDYSAED